MAYFTGINANNTASIMQKEYPAVFSTFEPEEGTEFLDAFAAERFTGPEWTDYAYSLALWMWKHGRLTDKVRERTMYMIRRGVSLEDYRDPADQRAQALARSQCKEAQHEDPGHCL